MANSQRELKEELRDEIEYITKEITDEVSGLTIDDAEYGYSIRDKENDIYISFCVNGTNSYRRNTYSPKNARWELHYTSYRERNKRVGLGNKKAILAYIVEQREKAENERKRKIKSKYAVIKLTNYLEAQGVELRDREKHDYCKSYDNVASVSRTEWGCEAEYQTGNTKYKLTSYDGKEVHLTKTTIEKETIEL